VIENYVKNVQNQILISKKNNQFNIIASHVFNIKNRIYVIDKLLKKLDDNNLDRLNCKSNFSKTQKFVLLKQTKFLNISKLTIYKKIRTIKTNKKNKLLNTNELIDKVLQNMFLNFLDVRIEDILKSEIYGFRKGRDARMIIGKVYSKLKQMKYLEQLYISSIKIKKYFNNVLQNTILKQYSFPKCYIFLLKR
jgi:retron-type reverse transcriptase